MRVQARREHGPHHDLNAVVVVASSAGWSCCTPPSVDRSMFSKDAMHDRVTNDRCRMLTTNNAATSAISVVGSSSC